MQQFMTSRRRALTSFRSKPSVNIEHFNLNCGTISQEVGTAVTVTATVQVVVAAAAVFVAAESVTETEAEIVILNGSGYFTTRKLRFTEIFPTLIDALSARER